MACAPGTHITGCVRETVLGESSPVPTIPSSAHQIGTCQAGHRSQHGLCFIKRGAAHIPGPGSGQVDPPEFRMFMLSACSFVSGPNLDLLSQLCVELPEVEKK